MADGRSRLLGLEAIQQRDLSEGQVNLIHIFGDGIGQSSPESIAEVVRQVDELCPALTEEKDARNYLWMLFDMVIAIARSPDSQSDLHEYLLAVLDSLRQRAKGELGVWSKTDRVWTDLPMFPQCLGDWFNDPFLSAELDEEPLSSVTPSSIKEWQNLNIFGARCLGAGFGGAYVQAMDAMRYALEEELHTGPEAHITECRIRIAHGWVTHAAKPLLWWAKENLGYTDVSSDDYSQYFENGPLYDGPSTMCLRRWGFWQDRFEDLGREGSDLGEEVRMVALDAVQKMKAAELRVAHTLSSSG